MSHSALTALSSEYNCIESEHHRGADLQQREGVPGQQHWDRPVISTLMRFNGKTGKTADHRESACAPHLMAKVMWHFPSNWIHSSESNWPWREVTYLQAGVVTCVCVCVCVSEGVEEEFETLGMRMFSLHFTFPESVWQSIFGFIITG